MKKILFICTANRFRSPAAEVIAASLVNKKKASVSSAGVYENEFNMPLPKSVRDALTRMGYTGGMSRRSQRVTKKMVKEAYVVLYMQPSHLSVLLEMFPQHKKRFKCLAEYDPCGKSKISDLAFLSGSRFQETLCTIEDCVINFLRHEKLYDNQS